MSFEDFLIWLSLGMEGSWNLPVLLADMRLNLSVLFQLELSSLLCSYINV